MHSSALSIARPSMRRAQPRRSRRDAIARGLAGTCVVAHLGGVVLLPSGTWLSHLWSDFFWTGGALACAIEHLRVGRAAATLSQRRGWLLLATGCFSWFVTMLWWSWRELVEGDYAPALELPSIGFAVMPLFFAAGLPLFRAERSGEGPGRLEWIVDAIVVVLLIGVIWAGLLYEPFHSFHGGRRELVAPLARAAGYSVALVVGALIFARPLDIRSATASRLLSALAILTGLYFVFVATLLSAQYQVGRTLDVFWTVAFAMLYLAGLEEERDTGERAPRGVWLASPMAFIWSVVLGSTALGLLLYRDLLRSIPHVSLVVVLVFAIVLAVRSDLMLAKERRARRAIQAALATRQEFLTIASHELRTPLTPMRIWVSVLTRQLAADGERALDRAALERGLSALDRALRRFERLADSLVEVARLEGGVLPRREEVVDLAALVHDVVEDVRAMASKEIRVTVDAQPGVRVACDRPLVEQALTELLTNAIRFGKDEPIALRVWMDGDTAKVSVRDCGIGIHPDLLPRVFEKFERGVPLDYGGLGLGLFITRTIVEAHGGTVEVESAPGAGATFTIALPSRTAASAGS